MLYVRSIHRDNIVNYYTLVGTNYTRTEKNLILREIKMNFGNWLGLNGIATLAASTAGVVITWMYCSSNRRKSKEKKLMINKARTIMLRLDRIDVAFCYDPIYRFVKHKVNKITYLSTNLE